MLDSNDLIKAIKKMVLETVDNTKPCNFVFGEVKEIDPLKIEIESKLVLSEKTIIIAKNVIKDTPLEVGDKLILLRQQGGQKFLAMDRVAE